MSGNAPDSFYEAQAAGSKRGSTMTKTTVNDCECGFYDDRRRQHHDLTCPALIVPPHLIELRDVRRWIIDHPLRRGGGGARSTLDHRPPSQARRGWGEMSRVAFWKDLGSRRVLFRFWKIDLITWWR